MAVCFCHYLGIRGDVSQLVHELCFVFSCLGFVGFFFCPDCCHLSQIVISISGTKICPLSLSVFHAGFSPFSLKVAVPPPPPPLLQSLNLLSVLL